MQWVNLLTFPGKSRCWATLIGTLPGNLPRAARPLIPEIKPHPIPGADHPNSGPASVSESLSTLSVKGRPQDRGFRKSTGSSFPFQTTVVTAGSVRGTTVPARITSRRGATSRIASISEGAAKATRSARFPTSSP